MTDGGGWGKQQYTPRGRLSVWDRQSPRCEMGGIGGHDEMSRWTMLMAVGCSGDGEDEGGGQLFVCSGADITGHSRPRMLLVQAAVMVPGRGATGCQNPPSRALILVAPQGGPWTGEGKTGALPLGGCTLPIPIVVSRMRLPSREDKST